MIQLPTLAADRSGDRTVQLAVTQARRSEHPDRTTWGPEDAPPAESHWDWREFVVDGEGDLWIRLTGDGPHKGEWQLRGYKPRLPFEEKSKPVPWQDLAAAYGPLTDLPSDWYRQRNEILEAVAGAMSDMDDILFHAWGAHTLGTDREHGPLIDDDDKDEDIVRHAQNIADRLTQQAAKIRTSLAAAHMVTPSEHTS
ncbi:hypothetical protein ACSCBZ_46305 [Streptomyces niveiscabiei]|uniref:hypothetical protein n=1 Tax=Streptomyces niveiscabiei TaxID=164115 RepID=UPI0006EB7B12|nr:hypothetical protein [Streptomyces niveiscabiei]